MNSINDLPNHRASILAAKQHLSPEEIKAGLIAINDNIWRMQNQIDSMRDMLLRIERALDRLGKTK